MALLDPACPAIGAGLHPAWTYSHAYLDYSGRCFYRCACSGDLSALGDRAIFSIRACFDAFTNIDGPISLSACADS